MRYPATYYTVRLASNAGGDATVKLTRENGEVTTDFVKAGEVGEWTGTKGSRITRVDISVSADVTNGLLYAARGK
jgi:hypothetical protein